MKNTNHKYRLLQMALDCKTLVLPLIALIMYGCSTVTSDNVKHEYKGSIQNNNKVTFEAYNGRNAKRPWFIPKSIVYSIKPKYNVFKDNFTLPPSGSSRRTLILTSALGDDIFCINLPDDKNDNFADLLNDTVKEKDRYDSTSVFVTNLSCIGYKDFVANDDVVMYPACFATIDECKNSSINLKLRFSLDVALKYELYRSIDNKRIDIDDNSASVFFPDDVSMLEVQPLKSNNVKLKLIGLTRQYDKKRQKYYYSDDNNNLQNWYLTIVGF